MESTSSPPTATAPVEIAPAAWWHDPPGERRLLRWALVGCQVATFFITWPLWEARDNAAAIPCLPIVEAGWVDAAQFSWFLPAVLSALAILAWPLPGLAVHTLVLLAAMAFDQVRMQPEFVSIPILLWGTLAWEGPRLLARLHLAALWFYAGLHKLMSAGYVHDSGPRGWTALFERLTGSGELELPSQFATVLAVGVAFYECALGILAVAPGGRRTGAILAAVLHLGIFGNLVATWWNAAVWPWNLALALAALGFLWDWEENPLADFARQAWAIQAAAVAIFVAPALFYVDLCDGYLAHCLYSSNVPSAEFAFVPYREYFPREEAPPPPDHPWAWRTLAGMHLAVLPEDAREIRHIGMRCYTALHVPFPPVQRLYDQLFRRIARPGDRLIIEDPRWYAAWRGYAERTLEKPPPP